MALSGGGCCAATCSMAFLLCLSGGYVRALTWILMPDLLCNLGTVLHNTRAHKAVSF